MEGDRWLYRLPIRKLMPILVEWLRKNFPTPYPVDIRFTEKKIYYNNELVYGICWYEDRKIHIRVHLVRNWWAVIHITLHEWAHANSLRHASMEKKTFRDHTEEWGLSYARMVSKLFDEGG